MKVCHKLLNEVSQELEVPSGDNTLMRVAPKTEDEVTPKPKPHWQRDLACQVCVHACCPQTSWESANA